ncbi:MAG: RC-LH1 core complex protein PufX [Pseudomonadota bacterium]
MSLKTSYTSREIASLMGRGAAIAAIVLTGIIGFMIVIWLIGGLLPEEARLSALALAEALRVA